MSVLDDLEIRILENNERVQALENLAKEARAFLDMPPCHEHGKIPCESCLVGTDWRYLREAVEEVELTR